MSDFSEEIGKGETLREIPPHVAEVETTVTPPLVNEPAAPPAIEPPATPIVPSPPPSDPDTVWQVTHDHGQKIMGPSVAEVHTVREAEEKFLKDFPHFFGREYRICEAVFVRDKDGVHGVDIPIAD